MLERSRTAFTPLRRYDVGGEDADDIEDIEDIETWTLPTVSGNRLFVKDVRTLALWTVTDVRGARAPAAGH